MNNTLEDIQRVIDENKRILGVCDSIKDINIKSIDFFDHSVWRRESFYDEFE